MQTKHTSHATRSSSDNATVFIAGRSDTTGLTDQIYITDGSLVASDPGTDDAVVAIKSSGGTYLYKAEINAYVFGVGRVPAIVVPSGESVLIEITGTGDFYCTLSYLYV